MRELQLKGLDIDLNAVIKDIEVRDEKDSTRKDSPLIIPKDAIIVDTTHYTIDDTVNRIKKRYLKRRLIMADEMKKLMDSVSVVKKDKS